MLPFQHRVVGEKADLDLRLELLKKFLESSRFLLVDPAERQRLMKQAEVMSEYSEILGERIAHFQPVPG